MSRREVAAKLREALKLMNDTGRHWIQGEFTQEIEHDEEGEVTAYGYCSLGAIRYVMGAPVEEPTPESTEVAMALANLLPAISSEVHTTDPEMIAFDRIVAWNDDSDRNWNDVVEKFNETAEWLETVEDSVGH